MNHKTCDNISPKYGYGTYCVDDDDNIDDGADVDDNIDDDDDVDDNVDVDGIVVVIDGPKLIFIVDDILEYIYLYIYIYNVE
jgi:hypothetical protein